MQSKPEVVDLTIKSPVKKSLSKSVDHAKKGTASGAAGGGLKKVNKI